MPPPQPPRKRKRSSFRFLFTVAVTTVMIATGGFGTFPKNSLTQTFQTVIGENFSADFLQPFNSYMESISAPTIQPKPASEPKLPFDLIGTLAGPPVSEATEALQTVVQTETTISTTTGTHTPTVSPSPSTTPTLTASPTFTTTPSPTWTPDIFYPTFTKTPKPTDVPAPFVGFTLSGVNLSDGSANSGTSITVAPGQTFYFIFDYQVFNDPCPGCITQLVAGLGTPGTNSLFCSYDGIPGVFPGVNGSEPEGALVAPSTPGTYSVIVEYHWQSTCADAQANYGSGRAVSSQVIGQIVVAPTSTATPIPFFTISSTNLNGAGTSVTVSAGASVVVTYNYQVYSDQCPGCITQLVTGLGTAGSPGGTCAYAGSPGIFPGVTGSENTTLTAPMVSGTYNVVVVYFWEANCANALTNYPAGAAQSSQIIGQIIVP